MSCLCLGSRRRDNHAFANIQVIASLCVVLCGRSSSRLNLFPSLASTHFLTLLISPLHNLPFSISVSLPTRCLVRLFWRPASLQGNWSSLKTQAGVGVVAAERDGYNNPCSGSTHVLNYCHKCSSIRLRQSCSSSDALSFSVT